MKFYNDFDSRYCKVEQSGVFIQNEDKTVSSEIKIVSEIGFVGLFQDAIEFIKNNTNPKEIIKDTDESSGYDEKIGSSGDYSVICCSGNNSIVKAKQGSWITLSEWIYSDKTKCNIPVCVKTEYVDGERIKEDTWYKLVDGEFNEVK